jgi:hypothetical protein
MAGDEACIAFIDTSLQGNRYLSSAGTEQGQQARHALQRYPAPQAIAGSGKFP